MLITPARNEAAFIERTLISVVRQTVRPARWVVVSDGSTDGTDDIVRAYATVHPWIELLRRPPRPERTFAGKVAAFNAGYARMKGIAYDVIGNLDADISLGTRDYFSFLLGKLAEDPALGLVGTPYVEGDARAGRWANLDYVAGACQLFRRACFEQIGGYLAVEQGGVDDIAVIRAAMKGWTTRTFTEKTCVHHRAHGSATHTALRARFRDGALDYALGSHPLWEVLRAFRQLTTPPRLVGGLMLLAGYLWSSVRRTRRSVSPEFVAFHRRQQLQRLARLLGARLPMVRWGRDRVEA